MIRLIFTIFIAINSLFVAANEFPDPPGGFTWVEFDAGKSAFLKPDGWHLKVESKNGTEALFITKESIESEGRFDTGLTVNYISGVKAKTGVIASQYAQAFLSRAEDKHTRLKSFKSEIGENITGFGLRVRLDREPAQIVHYFLVADDEADSLRIIMFESPGASWESAWVIGQQLLKGQMWR